MACFVAPAAVAVVTTVTRKVVKNREANASTPAADGSTAKVPGKWTQRLGWLNAMLWGGTALLALEHVWHGELVPWPPFLTAVQSADQIGPMLREIAVYGGAMTAAIVAVWVGMVLVAEFGPRWAQSRGTKPKAADRGA
jgi:hypothetical protein